MVSIYTIRLIVHWTFSKFFTINFRCDVLFKTAKIQMEYVFCLPEGVMRIKCQNTHTTAHTQQSYTSNCKHLLGLFTCVCEGARKQSYFRLFDVTIIFLGLNGKFLPQCKSFKFNLCGRSDWITHKWINWWIKTTERSNNIWRKQSTKVIHLTLLSFWLLLLNLFKIDKINKLE